MNEPDEKSGRVDIPVRLPADVARKVDRAAALAGIEPGQLLATLIAIELLRMSVAVEELKV